MMDLYVPWQCTDAIADHFVDHTLRQRGHENHRPGTEYDRTQHDYRAAVIAPQVAPGEQREDAQGVDHAARIASTGCRRRSRRAGYTDASSENRNTTAGPDNSDAKVTFGWSLLGRLNFAPISSMPGIVKPRTPSHAVIVPPTSQNQIAIEADLRDFVQSHLDLDDHTLGHRCEQVIRNHDPCISCATHFLNLTVERIDTKS